MRLGAKNDSIGKANNDMDSPMTDRATTEVIVEALKSAAEAHGRFEAEVLNGVYDAEWPEWYASHMAAWLKEQGYLLSTQRA